MLHKMVSCLAVLSITFSFVFFWSSTDTNRMLNQHIGSIPHYNYGKLFIFAYNVNTPMQNHYENMSMQYSVILNGSKIENF